MLVLPGYAMGRALRSLSPLTTAFPLSTLILTEATIACAYLGVTVCVATVYSSLAVMTIAALAVVLTRRSEGVSTSESLTFSAVPRWFGAIVATQIAVVLVGVLVKTTLFPLSGPDTPFRWDALARMLLDEVGFRHYPPITAEDFTSYVYPDGIPPLTSVVYWCLYAGWGAYCPRITSVAVGFQLLSCIVFAFSAARTLYGTVGGLLAVTTLLSSNRFLTSFLIGQETGYICLAVAGQLAFSIAAIQNPRLNYAVLAGMFAGLGGLSREYGALLSLCGASVLLRSHTTRRLVLPFCAVAAACMAPWYLRNWLITGNPLYPMDVLDLGFPANAVHEGLHASYKAHLGLHTLTFLSWIRVLGTLFLGAPVALVLGVPGLVLTSRRGIALTSSVVVISLIWLWSIPYTVGGIHLSMRVLTPAIVVLSISAAACGPVFQRMLSVKSKWLQVSACVPLIFTGCYAALSCWTYPGHPWELKNMAFLTWMFPDDSMGSNNRVIREVLERVEIEPLGVLTDDPYLAVTLQRSKRLRPVPIFSPEVAFVFDKALMPSDVRRRLREKNIWFASLPISENADYLMQFPFYEQDRVNWQGVQISDVTLYPICFLPP